MSFARYREMEGYCQKAEVSEPRLSEKYVPSCLKFPVCGNGVPGMCEVGLFRGWGYVLGKFPQIELLKWEDR